MIFVSNVFRNLIIQYIGWNSLPYKHVQQNIPTSMAFFSNGFASGTSGEETILFEGSEKDPAPALDLVDQSFKQIEFQTVGVCANRKPFCIAGGSIEEV